MSFLDALIDKLHIQGVSFTFTGIAQSKYMLNIDSMLLNRVQHKIMNGATLRATYL